jgi:hypothetical protein
MLKSPHGSPRKTREKIATKTGVEKMMTELKLTKAVKKFVESFFISPVAQLHVLEGVKRQH